MKLAVPGEFAGIVEEIAPGENTFEENGAIYVTTVGAPVVDTGKRMLGIKPVKPLRPLRKGDVATCIITELYDQIAQVEILEVEAQERVAMANPHAFIRISELDKGYVEYLRDNIKTGDYIRAKVIDITDLGTYLTIAYPELGVIKAVCAKCRSETTRSGAFFTCNKCGLKERRKAAALTSNAV